jgi:hypothetical protein
MVGLLADGLIHAAFINFFWPKIIGGCELQRNTEKWLREAGPWADIDLAPMAGMPWYNLLPKIVGILTK